MITAADLDHNGTLDFAEFAQRFNPFSGNEQGPIVPQTWTTAADNRPIRPMARLDGPSGWDDEGPSRTPVRCQDGTLHKAPSTSRRPATSPCPDPTSGSTRIVPGNARQQQRQAPDLEVLEMASRYSRQT